MEKNEVKYDFFFGGIMSSIGILTGLGWAYKKGSSGWGYVGYAILFMFIGATIGGIIDSVRYKIKSDKAAKLSAAQQSKPAVNTPPQTNAPTEKKGADSSWDKSWQNCV